MPKSVTTVTAAHISMLIDFVQAVAGQAKPRLMEKEDDCLRLLSAQQLMHMIIDSDSLSLSLLARFFGGDQRDPLFMHRAIS